MANDDFHMAEGCPVHFTETEKEGSLVPSIWSILLLPDALRRTKCRGSGFEELVDQTAAAPESRAGSTRTSVTPRDPIALV